MDKIEKIIKNTNEENQEKIDWTKVWSSKYKILKTYQKEINITKYKNEITNLLNDLQKDYGYSDLDAMLVLKDILAHVYFDSK